MLHRTILWVVLPLTTTTVFGILMGPILDPKWSLLICVLILGILAILAAIENASFEAKPDTKKPSIAGSVLGWIITLPMTKFIAFTLGCVNSDINVFIYALMMAASLLAVVVICIYVRYMWKDIQYYNIVEEEEEVDDEDS